VVPKQLTFFFNIFISFSILEEVENAIDILDGEAWQTCEDKLFFKEIFSFEAKSSSFE